MKKRFVALVTVVSMIITLTPTREFYAETLPEKYKTEEVTSVKDQGNTNLCWAFSTVAAMEIDLIKNEGVDPMLDLSELQIACFRQNSAMDPLGQQHMMFSGSNAILGGGKNFVVGALLGTGLSPIEESMIGIPFEKASNDTRIDESLAYTGRYYMKEFKLLMLPGVDTIKRAIMEYGAVVAGAYTDLSNYNQETFGWYNPEFVSANHMVCIVGWDDTYSKDNFTTTPPGDGAWIIKNSLGESWGEGGFYYASYYDSVLLHPRAEYAVYDMEVGKYADNLYQNAFQVTSYLGSTNGKTDWSKTSNGCEYSKVANVFTAQANDSGAEELTGVSLFTFESSKYDICIYKNVKESSNPESGTLVATITGEIETPGFRIIPLEIPVYLSEGESYAIVASLINAAGKYSGVAKSDITQTTSTPTYGQSYIYNERNDQWSDLAFRSSQNLYLNAYTNNIDKNETMDMKKVSMNRTWGDNIKKNMIPETVTGVKAKYSDSTSAILTWDGLPDTEYIVYLYNAVADTWKKFDFVESGKSYYVAKNLVPGTSYTFGVKAATKTDERGRVYLQSLDYADVTVTTRTELQMKASLAITDQGNTLSWEQIDKATKYEIYVMSPLTDYEWSYLSTVSADQELSYTDTNVIEGLVYSYRVYVLKENEVMSKGIPMTGMYE